MPLTGKTRNLTLVVDFDIPCATILAEGVIDGRGDTGEVWFAQQMGECFGSALSSPFLDSPIITFGAYSSPSIGPEASGYTGIITYTLGISIHLKSGTFSASVVSTSGTGSFVCTIETHFQSSVTTYEGWESAFFSEVIQAGDSWTLSVNSDGGSASNSGTFSAADVISVVFDPARDYTGSMDLYVGSKSFTGGVLTPSYASGSCSMTLDGAPISTPHAGVYQQTSPLGVPYPGQTVSVDFTDGIYVVSTVNESAPGFSVQLMGGHIDGQFATQFELVGDMFQLDQYYPKPLVGVAQMLTNEPGYGTQQLEFTVGNTFGFSPPFNWQTNAWIGFDSRPYGSILGVLSYVYSQDYYLTGFSAFVTPASLAAQGEDTGTGTVEENLYTFEMAVKPYDAISLTIDNNVVWDDLSEPKRWYPGGGSSSPTGYPNTTGYSGDILQFDTTADSSGHAVTQDWVAGTYPATVTTTYDVQEPDCSGFRFMSFQVRSMTNAKQPFTVQITDGYLSIPDKYWKFQTGNAGAWITITVDLCAPSYGGEVNPEPGALPILQDSKYMKFWIFNDWGIILLNELRLNFTGLPDQYQIQDLKLFSVEEPLLSFLQEPDEIFDANIPIDLYPIPTQPKRVCTIDTDGRRAEGAYQLPSGIQTVGNLVAELNAIQGFSASNLAISGDWNESQWAQDVGGNGGIVSGSSGQSNWIRQPFTSGTIQGQFRPISLICPPNCGDILGEGGGSGSVPIHLRLRLRGAFTGLTLNPQGQPVASDPVNIVQNGNAFGSTVSDAEAHYNTGATYVPAGSAVTLSSTGNSILCLNGTDNRLIRRVSVSSSPLGTSTWIHEDYFGQLHLATVNGSGDVLYYRSNFTLPDSNGWAVSGAVTAFGDVQTATMAVDHTARAWICLTRRSGTLSSIWGGYSDDDGVSFGYWFAIMTGAVGGSNWSDYWGGIGYTWFMYGGGSSSGGGSGVGSGSSSGTGSGFGSGSGSGTGTGSGSGSGSGSGAVNSGPGYQYGITKGQGDAMFSPVFVFRDSTNTPILVADGGWCNVVQAADAQDRLIWCPTLAGNTSPSVLYSTDNGRTWFLYNYGSNGSGSGTGTGSGTGSGSGSGSGTGSGTGTASSIGGG